jgi:hypothetical protein
VNQLAWAIDAAKIGAMAIISGVLVYSSTLLASELKLPKIRPAARNMIYVFMGFSLACLLVAVGLEIWKVSHDADVQVQVTAIDTALDGKIKNEINCIQDATKRRKFITFTDEICKGVKNLAKLVSVSVNECMNPQVPNPPLHCE